MIHPAPKPRKKRKAKKAFSSIKRPDYKDALVAAQRLRSTTPVKKFNPEKRAKRQKQNQEYYKSAEWRAKRQAGFARDGFQCVELLTVRAVFDVEGDVTASMRCDNFGEVVNGKQTSRGLVCEEVSY